MENRKTCNDGGYDEITTLDDCKEAFEKVGPHPKKQWTSPSLTVKRHYSMHCPMHCGMAVHVSVNVHMNLTASASVSARDCVC